MACSRCGSDDHNLSGCKWPSVKPRIRRVIFNMWVCRTLNTPLIWPGLGYTPRDAYEDWKTLNKKDQTCEQSTE